MPESIGWCRRSTLSAFPPFYSFYQLGTEVCRYNWHSAGSLGWPFPMLKYKRTFLKIYGSNFIKQHSETVVVWNYQNADCSLKNKCIVSFIVTFRHTLVPCRLLVPSVKLSTVGGRAFPVAGPTIWNSLPDNVISTPSLSTFRQRLKTFLFRGPRSLALSSIRVELFQWRRVD